MNKYKQLSQKERELIFVLLNKKKSIRYIGKVLFRQPSTISREVKKNFGKNRYRPHCAHERAVVKQCCAHKKERLKSNALRLEVEHKLSLKWSPELIAGRLKQRADLPSISHESIYQWIYSEAPHLIGHLTRFHQTRWPKGKSKCSRSVRISNRIPVSERPDLANNRTQAGHWEADLVVGNGRSALQVIVERQTRLTKLLKIHNKTAAASSKAITNMLIPLNYKARRSITYDNGMENVLHQNINDSLGTSSFFCQPFHAWEKGTIENTNGLIRRFLPKKTNFDIIQDSTIQQVESWLNNRPRKCLDFKTPQESFNSLCCT